MKTSQKICTKKTSSSVTYLPHAGFLFGLFCDLQTGGDICSEMPVDCHETTWHYVPDDETLHKHICENLTSYDLNIPFYMQT